MTKCQSEGGKRHAVLPEVIMGVVVVLGVKRLEEPITQEVEVDKTGSFGIEKWNILRLWVFVSRSCWGQGCSLKMRQFTRRRYEAGTAPL